MTIAMSSVTLIEAHNGSTRELESLDKAGFSPDLGGSLLAGSFSELPQAGWLVPSIDERAAPMRNHFKLTIDYALRNGGYVDLLSNLQGIAVWIHAPGGVLPPPDPEYTDLLKQGTGPYFKNFEEFDATLARHHPHGTDHDYLACIGVHPDFRGRGYGRLLLQHACARLDRNQRAAYLEAATPRNVALYEGLGFRDRGQFHLPRSGPLMFQRWRPPAAPDK